jgi:hypothetical protein
VVQLPFRRCVQDTIKRFGETAMTAAFKLFRSKFWHPRDTRLDDHLLCDIGVSRMQFEYRQG